MWIYDLKQALRSILNRRLYSAISIIGLAVGMTVSILIFTFVRFEAGFDSMHPNSERTYRLNWVSGGSRFATFFNPVTPAMALAFPEIESFTRVAGGRIETLTIDGVAQRSLVSLVDNDFFRIFHFDTIAGDPTQAIQDMSSMVLTEAAASNLFGERNPIGQLVQYNDSHTFRVAAVVSNNPANSHLGYNIFINIENLESVWNAPGFWNNVGSDVMYHYIQLTPGTDPLALETNLEDFYREQFSNGGNPDFVLQPLRDIHFTTDLQNEMPMRDDLLGITKNLRQRTDILLFSAVAALALFIAAVNFMNLQLVQFTRRTREVGIRRIAGSSRLELVRQFLIESLLISMLSLGLALLLCEILMPGFNTMVAASITTELVIAGDSILILIALAVVIGLGAGLYPAVAVARISPQDALKGEIIKGVSSAKYRSGLIILQFAISIGLIIAAGIVNTQINYALSKSLGFDPDNVITVELPPPARSGYDAMRSDLRNIPGVVAVSAGSTLPTHDLSDGDAMFAPGGDPTQPLLVRTVLVEDDYFSTLNMPMVAGRALDDDYPSDFMGTYSITNINRDGGVVLNETAAQQAGFATPEAAIGAQFRQDGIFNGINFTSVYTVVGVVQDAHFGSIRQPIASISFIQADSPGVLMIRLSDTNQAQTLAGVDRVLEEHMPGMRFGREFLSESYSAFYTGEERTFTLFIVLSTLAVGIACLGLYAVTAFIAERRTREISIRKVLGATVRNLISLLTWDFSKLVLVANIVAWPLAYLAMQQWLSNFAYRADVSILVFLVAGLVTFMMALVTTLQRAWVAAMANPVNSLRAE